MVGTLLTYSFLDRASVNPISGITIPSAVRRIKFSYEGLFEKYLKNSFAVTYF